jgi:hypothetical protein
MCARPQRNQFQRFLSRIRKNHALEHATVHILAQRYPHKSLIGRSDNRGFFIYGDLSADTLQKVANEALMRLRNGETQLAIHPNCGTNLVTSASLAGVAAFFSLFGSKNDDWRKRLERLPTAIILSVMALIIAQPLGNYFQKRFTTNADIGSLEILSTRRIDHGSTSYLRVLTSD